jgi:hypothetical protein
MHKYTSELRADELDIDDLQVSKVRAHVCSRNKIQFFKLLQIKPFLVFCSHAVHAFTKKAQKVTC